MKIKHNEFAQKNMNFDAYVEQNTLLLMLLDPLLLNASNLEMFIRINGIEVVGTVMFAQRLPSDKEGGRDGNKRSEVGLLVPAEHDQTMLSHLGAL